LYAQKLEPRARSSHQFLYSRALDVTANINSNIYLPLVNAPYSLKQKLSAPDLSLAAPFVHHMNKNAR